MSDLDQSALLVELPDDLRQEVMNCAVAKQISLAWLVKLYRRGVNAKIGATGHRPFGALSPNDEGELAVALAADPQHGVVRIEFGKPVAWLALPAGHARQLAKLLLEKAGDVERKIS